MKKTGKKSIVIEGVVDDERLSSKQLEEVIQRAVSDGAREFRLHADGQHGIGGRVWPVGDRVLFEVDGPVGQRLGGMGLGGTEIIVNGSASDDVGWLNCGSKITVLGDVTNGAHNAGAQGVLYVQGGGGARCDTMTKFNPRFEPLQSWYFRDVGDSFAEFKAGGIAVVCGVEPRNPENILGYRPCVGMVGGTIYFRGKVQGYSEGDVRLAELNDRDWEWLTGNIKPYLEAIDRRDYHDELTQAREQWRKFVAYTPEEKAERAAQNRPDLTAFRLDVWEKEVGRGGMFGAYLEHPRSILPFVTSGVDRRDRPVWNNAKYSPPCVGACPSDIPTALRTSLIRQGKSREALELVLQYSPLPGTVCGQICPNLCMDACSRGFIDRPLDIKNLGSLSLDLPAPETEPSTGKKVAVIGGGPGGLSAAWHLALRGHKVELYEAASKLGGKLELCIPRERLPQAVLDKELARFADVGIEVHLKTPVDKALFKKIHADNDIVIVACGAHEPRKIPFDGAGDVIAGYEFLRGINSGEPMDLTGQEVVIIGAGNVGMDVASQAFACGAKTVTAVDIQAPASFGKEQEMAVARGAKIVYPKITERYDAKAGQVYFKDGTSMKADTMFVSIGEVPELGFLPPDIDTERGLIRVNKLMQTTDVEVFAVGDATGAGLVTHAIGEGRRAAEAAHALMMDYDYVPEPKMVIPYRRVRNVYYQADIKDEDFEIGSEANRCMSCGTCRDCGICVATCFYGAISRFEGPDGSWEYVVDDDKCIGCAFCVGTCPTGVWEMEANV